MNMYYVSLLTAEELDQWIETLTNERKCREIEEMITDQVDKATELKKEIKDMEVSLDIAKHEHEGILNYIEQLNEAKKAILRDLI